MKAQEWEQMRELGVPELHDREKDLSEQLFKLRLSKSLGQIDNALKLRETRRQIARVKTLIREKADMSKLAAAAKG
jgi:large subunit ribosomal protein L29